MSAWIALMADVLSVAVDGSVGCRSGVKRVRLVKREGIGETREPLM